MGNDFDLSDEQKNDLDATFAEIKKLGNGTINITDRKLKLRIAKFIEVQLELTFNSEEEIAETAYTINGLFGRYSYGDDLEKIMGSLGELELPSHASKNPKKLFEDTKSILKEYQKL